MVCQNIITDKSSIIIFFTMMKYFILTIAVIGMANMAWATSTFEVPEHIGNQEWVEATGFYLNAGGEKILFTNDSFVPSAGKIDTITYASHDSPTQVSQFGIPNAYVISYQNYAIAVLNEKWIGFTMAEPRTQYSIEFEGDTVRFHNFEDVFASGTLNNADSKSTPFLKCNTDEMCGFALAKTTNS